MPLTFAKACHRPSPRVERDVLELQIDGLPLGEGVGLRHDPRIFILGDDAIADRRIAATAPQRARMSGFLLRRHCDASSSLLSLKTMRLFRFAVRRTKRRDVHAVRCSCVCTRCARMSK